MDFEDLAPAGTGTELALPLNAKSSGQLAHGEEVFLARESFVCRAAIRDFDVSPDGHEVVLERVQERSDVVLLDIPRS